MRHALIVLLVFLSGCVSFHERTCEVTPASSNGMTLQKKIAGSMIIERIEEHIKELAEEQFNLTMVMEHIKSDLKENDEWIRSGNEFDLKESCKL
jgi:PBP1b-binding outer membrane lipoprotein LpoB